MSDLDGMMEVGFNCWNMGTRCWKWDLDVDFRCVVWDLDMAKLYDLHTAYRLPTRPVNSWLMSNISDLLIPPSRPRSATGIRCPCQRLV